MKLTQDLLYKLIIYNPITGKVRWKKRDRKYFNKEANIKYGFNKNHGKTEVQNADI